VSFTFVYAWELGTGTGHVNMFKPLADALEVQGHKVVPVVQDTSIAKNIGFTSAWNKPKAFHASDERALCHTSILHSHAGFFDTSNLLITVKNWLAIFEAADPAIILCDYAPAARLAARIAKVPAVAIDSGFFTPPADQSLPIFCSQTKDELAILRQLEKTVVDNANTILAYFNAPLVNDCAQLLQPDYELFPHYAALDVYDRKNKSGFVGPFINFISDEKTSKPQQLVAKDVLLSSLPKKKAFVYFYHLYPLALACIEALLAEDVAITAYIPDAKKSPRVLELAGAGNFTLLVERADMHSLLPTVDMVVCLAGVGTIDTALFHGKPLLLVPTFSEQTFNAFRVSVNRLGSYFQFGVWPEPALVVRQFLRDLPDLTKSCEQFTAENSIGDVTSSAETLVKWVNDANQVDKNVPRLANLGHSYGGDKGIRFSELDVIFLSYDEPNADSHFELLQQLAPHAKRVHGVKGFDAAHKAAAGLASTERFVTVDADTQVFPHFFTTDITVPPHIQFSTWSWASENTVNGLCYGNGGLKIWHKDMVASLVSHEQAKGALAYDFCHHAGYSQYDAHFSATYPNASPRQAFRAGLREVVKLGRGTAGEPISPNVIAKQMRSINMRRLLIWMTVGADSLNGYWMLLGARTGFWLNTKPDFNPETITDFGRFAEYWDKNYAQLALRPWQDVANAVTEIGEKIRKELGFTLLEDWGDQRSKAFKLQMTQRRPPLSVFEVNRELL
jgi:UDP:flavonoid glycosyltransferase YjiC (YdhE family)